MATVMLVLVVVLVVAGLVFGIVSLLSGDDPGLSVAEEDGRAVAMPNHRSLTETDLKSVRFDLGFRGYRMAQVDRVLRRTAYDVGYKDEMIAVLEAEVAALREGRTEDAVLLRKARESASSPVPTMAPGRVAAPGEERAAEGELLGYDSAPTEAATPAEPASDAAPADEVAAGPSADAEKPAEASGPALAPAKRPARA